MYQLNLSFDALTLADASEAPTPERLSTHLLEEITKGIEGLPGSLTLEEAAPVATTLEMVAAHGEDFTHLVRYYLGAVALRVKKTLPHGSDPMGKCADAWGLPHATTLRIYAAAAKRTSGNVQLFYRYLKSEGTYKTQVAIREFSALMKDPELMPEDVAREQRMRETERAVRTIEHNLDDEDDEETRQSVTVMVAETAGLQLDYENVEQPIIVAREAYGSGYTQAEAYAKLIDDDVLPFLEEATKEWCVWNGVKAEPRAARALRKIVEWSRTLICDRMLTPPDEVDVFDQEPVESEA